MRGCECLTEGPTKVALVNACISTAAALSSGFSLLYVSMQGRTILNQVIS